MQPHHSHAPRRYVVHDCILLRYTSSLSDSQADKWTTMHMLSSDRGLETTETEYVKNQRKQIWLNLSNEQFEWYTIFLGNLSTIMQRKSLVCKHERVFRDGQSLIKCLYRKRDIFWLKLSLPYWCSQIMTRIDSKNKAKYTILWFVC